MPVAAQHVDEEMADAAGADAHRGGRPAIDVFALKKVLSKLLLSDEIGGRVVALAEHTQGPHIGLLGALAEAVELQGIDRFLVPVGHHGVSPLVP